MASTIKLTASLKCGFRVDTQGGGHTIIIDQPEAAGGKNEGPNPLVVFLSALGGCLASIAAIIARQERLEIKAFDVEVEGDIDKAFLLGKTEEGRAGFTEIRAKVNLDADMTDEEKKAFLERVDARCPISDNMVNNTKVAISLE